MEGEFDFYSYMDDYEGEEFYDDMDESPIWDDESNYYETSGDPVTFMQMVDDCLIPTVTQAFFSFGEIIAYCLVLRLIIVTGWFSSNTMHFVSALLGLLALYRFFSSAMTYVIIFGAMSYFVLLVMRATIDNLYGPAVALFMFLFLIICELLLADPVKWHSVRGALMILGMKVISLGFDLDRRLVEKIPAGLEYLAFCLCPGSVIFGPWHSYSEYKKIFLRPAIDVRWVLKMVKSSVFAFLCLIVSTCGSAFLLGGYTERWISAYRDALSYRTSHYFVSYMSEGTMVALGAGRVGSAWEMDVSRPQFIEIPRSLVEVVISWNLPMHYWLKTYVFKQLKRFNYFTAILGTYAASALLHGLNFQLAAVLLSLGFYTYIEHNIRRKFSETFDACIEARSCDQSCTHKNKKYKPAVLLTNLGFGALAVFHLAYLGVMFNSEPVIEETGYNMWHTVKKWADLGYASHKVAILTCLIHFLVG